MYTPFTYYLYHPETNQHYYGVRYCKGCDPSSLWTTYFSSSRKVKKLIEEYGPDSFVVSIRKKFTTKEDAVKWEHTVLRRLNVRRKLHWLNQTDKPVVLRSFGYKHTEETKVKQRQSHIGKPKSIEHAKNISLAKTGHKMSDDFRTKCRLRHTGRKDAPETIAKRAASNTGKKRTPETIEKIRQAALRRHSKDKDLSLTVCS
jgi:hypothetical protein